MEQQIRIPEGVSALPGKVRLWKSQKGIADAISDPAKERVTIVKPVRVGFTTLLTGAIGSFVANEPSPILALLPTEADARDYVVSDVEPIFDASPVLRGLLSADTEEGGRNTLLHRRFPGGSIKFVAAKAPRNLRRHNVRALFIDEADAMEVGKEGSPILLAEKRTLSFANRKIVMGSTPIFVETSHVLRAYALSDQRIFEVPCPSCGAFTEILWGHIEWEPDQPATAKFRCPTCKELIDERHKPAMVEAGDWRALRPEVTDHAGFRLNALVSLLANASWPKLAAEFLKAKESFDELQVFTNTILAQGWQDAGEVLDEMELQARAEPFGLNVAATEGGPELKIPDEVLCLTAGVDVQDDRLEISIIGWTRDGVALVLGHEVIWGSPGDDTTWAELDELLKTAWRHPYGGSLRIEAAIVDSGDGDWTDTVYAFCFPRLNRKIMAGKGVYGSRPYLEMSKGKVKGGRLFLLGVDVIKTTIVNRLAKGQSIRFSATLPPVYYEQVASERKVVRYKRGLPTRVWERIKGRAAEALDCLVMAFAARQAVRFSPDKREDELRKRPPPARAENTERSWFSDVGDRWTEGYR
jgi:phage terminase large subunit GpA-like protein